jgi:hypothetical protein
VFLYKEDFNKFLKALTEAVDYVKTELMPDFNFDAYNHDEVPAEQGAAEVTEVSDVTELRTEAAEPIEISEPSENNNPTSQEEVDKW